MCLKISPKSFFKISVVPLYPPISTLNRPHSCVLTSINDLSHKLSNIQISPCAAQHLHSLTCTYIYIREAPILAFPYGVCVLVFFNSTHNMHLAIWRGDQKNLPLTFRANVSERLSDQRGSHMAGHEAHLVSLSTRKLGPGSDLLPILLTGQEFFFSFLPVRTALQVWGRIFWFFFLVDWE